MKFIYVGCIISLIYMSVFVYDYLYGEFSRNEEVEIKKDMDINRLPKIIYDDDTINKLYDSISLKNEYNNKNNNK